MQLTHDAQHKSHDALDISPPHKSSRSKVNEDTLTSKQKEKKKVRFILTDGYSMRRKKMKGEDDGDERCCWGCRVCWGRVRQQHKYHPYFERFVSTEQLCNFIQEEKKGIRIRQERGGNHFSCCVALHVWCVPVATATIVAMIQRVIEGVLIAG